MFFSQEESLLLVLSFPKITMMNRQMSTSTQFHFTQIVSLHQFILTSVVGLLIFSLRMLIIIIPRNSLAITI